MATTWKDPVKVATTEKFGSPPKIPGDGKIDGVTLTAGDRVLVKDQVDSKENGIYEVQAGPPLTLARPVGETVEPEDAVRVSEGNTNPHTEWALGAQGAIVVATTPLPWVRRDPFFNVLDFGADPTGTADSWQAFKNWSTAISNAGGGIGLVPAGTYLICKFSDADGTEDFTFVGCNGLWLVGYGAKLNLRGGIHLKLVGKHSTDKHMVCPFYLKDCHNVCLEGFEVNGNADTVTKDANVNEPGGNCVSVRSSMNVTIRHMRIHHGWTDGISIACFNDHLPLPPKVACRQIIIENCEIFACARGNVSVHETRNVRISNCRIYNGGITGGTESLVFSPSHGIDIEPDFPRTEGGVFYPTDAPNQFTVIENCEIYNNLQRALAVNVRYSQVRVQGCFIDNQHNDQQPVILSVPHCALLDCEIDTGAGRIDVALTGADPGDNVFTMERCLIRSNTAMVNGVLTTGAGLFIAPDPTAKPDRIKQALVANNRFINESTQAWFPVVDGAPVDNGSRFPNLSHGDLMLQLTFRDNYVFIPKAAYHGKGDAMPAMPAVGMHVHLAENNVYDTDLYGDGDFFEVLYGSGTPPKFGVLVRNERFLSAGDGKSFRPGDNSSHDNMYPYSQGVDALGGELKGDILKLGEQRVLFAVTPPSRGVFRQGDLIFNTRPLAGSEMGWVCTKSGTADVDAEFKAMPKL